jgi:hypothetical protein
VAIAAEKLRVDVEANTSKAKAEVGSFDKALGAPARGFGMLKGAAVAFAGTAVAAFAGKTIMAASDLNEEVSKAGVVFGKSTGIVIDQANKMADAFGLPKTQMIGAASSIGLVAKASGLGKKPAADMANSLSKLAADASSFYNVPLDEALDSMKSGLVGEAEPMRRFGVLLSENAVKAQAAKMGFKAVNGEFTEGQKVQARSVLIMKGMSDASGDLARTQDSVANRLREIKGRAVNAAASLGTALLPAVSATLGALIDFGGWISRTVGKFREWLANSKPVQDIIASIGEHIGALRAWIVQMIPVVEAWLQQMGQRLLPIIQQVAQWVMANLVPAIQQFAAFVKNDVLPVVASLAQWFMTKIVPAAMRIWEVVAQNLMPIFTQLVATFRGSVLPVLQQLMAKFRENQPAIQAVVEKIQTFMGHLLKIASVILGTVLPPLIRLAGWLLEKLVPVIATVIIWAIKLVGKVFDVADAFLSAITAVTKFVGKVASGIASAVEFVNSLPQKVQTALSAAGTWLLEAGKDLVRGFINGIKAMAGEAAKAAENMAKAAVDKAKSFLHIGSPSKLLEQIGQWTGQGFINGLSGTADAVGATMDALMAKVHDSIGKGQQGIEDKIVALTSGAEAKLKALGDKLTQTQDYFGQVANSMLSAGNVSGLGTTTNEDGSTAGPTGAGILGDLQKRVSDAAAFAQNLATLKARGLNAKALADLAQAGVEQGGAAAAALAATGAATIAQINTQMGLLAIQANKAAAVGSAAMYEAGKQTAKGLAAGFRSQRQQILDTMDNIAEAMVRRLRRQLGINSPARATKYVGRMTGLGVVEGADGTLRDIRGAADRMGQAALPDPPGGFRASGWQPGMVPVGATATNGGGPAIGEVHFHESDLTPTQQANALTWALSTRSR